MNINLNQSNYEAYLNNKQELSFGRKKDKDNNRTTNGHTNTFMHKGKTALVGAGLALATMVGTTACSDQHQEVNINLDKLFEYLDKVNERLDNLIDSMESGFKDLLKELKNINSNMVTKEDFENYKKDIIALLDRMGIKNEEFRAQILEILANNQEDSNARYVKIMEAFANLASILEKVDNSIKEGDKQTSADLNALLQAFLSSSDKFNEKFDIVINGQIENNKDNKEIIAQLEKLRQDIANGNLSQLEALKRLEEILGNIDANVSIIVGKIDSVIDAINNLPDVIVNSNKDIIDELKNIQKQHDEKQISDAEYQKQALLLLASINTNDSLTNTKLDLIYDKLTNGLISGSEAIEQIKEILQHISDNTDTIVGQLDKLIGEVASLPDYIQTSNKEVIDELKNIQKQHDEKQISDAEYQKQALALLASIDTKNSAANQQLENIYNKLQNGSVSAEEALKQITEILQHISDTVDSLVEKIDVLINEVNNLPGYIQTSNKEVIDELKNIQKQHDNKAISDAEYQKQALALLASIDTKNSAANQQLQNIYNQLLNGSVSGEEALNKIQEILQHISDTVDAISGKIDTLIDGLNNLSSSFTNSNREIINELKNIQKQHDNKDISDAEYQKQVLAYLASLDTKSQAGNDKLDEILKEIQSGRLTAAEGLALIQQTLNSINDSVKGIAADMKTVIANQVKYGDKAAEYYTSAFNQLKYIGEKIIDPSVLKAAFDVAVSNQNKSLQNEDKIISLMGDMINKIAGSGNGLSKDDLIDGIKIAMEASGMPSNIQDIKDFLDKFLNDETGPSGDVITASKLEQLFKKYQSKVDLSTITTSLKNLEELTAAINKQVGEGGSIGGSVDLSGLKSSVDAILTKLNEPNNLPTAADIKKLEDKIQEIVDQLKGGGSPEVTAAINNAERAIRQLKNAAASQRYSADANYSRYAKQARSEYYTNKAHGEQNQRSTTAGRYNDNTFYWG